MKTIAIIFWIICGFAVAGHPESVTTLDGKTYQGISSVKPAGNAVRIVHQDGSVTIPYAQIPESLWVDLGYDPAAAAAQDQRDAAAAREAARNYQKSLAAAAKSAARAEVITARKQKALAKLKASRFGGASYWRATRDARVNQRGSAVNSLANAGYTYAEAGKIVQSLIDAGKSDQHPDPLPSKPVPAEFLRPQGVLRNVPASP